MVNINPFIRKVKLSLEAHQTGQEGRYRRRLSDPMVQDLYGTADAVNILYTLGELPEAGQARTDWVESLQSFQEEASGLFPGAGHHAIHGTAFVVSALELLDARPLYPIKELLHLKQRDELFGFMDELDWKEQPWSESQKGAGIYAALVLSGSVNAEWEDWYFQWLWEQADPETGLWRKGAIKEDAAGMKGAPLFHHLAGSFHYLFNQDYRKRRIRYPEKLVDTCLSLYGEGQLPFSTESFSFYELDWLYSFVSVMNQTEHRAKESKAMVKEIGERFLRFIVRMAEGPDEEVYEDLHTLCGAVCALAIVQSVLPEQIESDRQLRKVLDRRPFI
ncbi:hypothetical protein [Gorillibacterium sp. sgz5001074]|uniref:hypothetical protein n=1 Tax=Gorillibacterium sp. sgz5001074 TaxID=3446695 RepID=UPI003F668714